MPDRSNLRPVVWIGASYRDFLRFPEAVKSRMGYALYVAQQGDKHRDARPLRGFGGAGVLEIVGDHSGDTFRCIYTVRIAGFVYVLHAFQKKSKTGRETPKAEIETIKKGTSRRGRSCTRVTTMKRKSVSTGSDNIFANIGLPNAEEHLLKAQLVYKIDCLMKARKLKQTEAAKLLGVRQPDISNMLRGDFRQFSVERLLRFLVALGQDVEIVVKTPKRSRKTAQLRVA